MTTFAAPSRRRPPLARAGAPSGRASGPAAKAPSELERTTLLFGLLFLAALVLVVGRTARDALFLTRFPVAWVAPLWLAYAVVSSLAALGFPALAARVPRARFIVAFCAVAALSYAALRVLIAEEVRAAYVVFYVWSEVVANFGAVLVWALAQDLHDARSAKRLFGTIGAGRVVGVVVSGFGTGILVRWLGTENLILVLIVALFAMAALTLVVARRHPAATQEPQRAAGAARLERMPVWRSRYALALALMTMLLFAALTIGDYQFKAIATSAHPTTDELAGFMANFYGVLGAAGLVIQLWVTPRLLSRYGVIAGLAALPAAFVAATAGLLAAPGLVLATLVKGSDNGLQFTVHEATMQVLFFPFPPAQREAVRSLASGFAKPLGYGLGAVLLIAFAPRLAVPGAGLAENAARLGYLSLPLGLCILAGLPLVRRGYVDAMRRTLIRREIEPALVENTPAARVILLDALASDDSPRVIFAVDRLREIDLELTRPALPRLASHRSSRVRALAQRLGRELEDPRGPELARQAVTDPVAEVRIAAVESLAWHLREDALDELDALAARADDDAVRTAAIAALVRDCGLDGMLAGAPRLRELLDGETTSDRVAAARVLGMVGERSLQRALARLIGDRDPHVRRAAIQAATTATDPRLLPHLLGALAERSVAGAAAKAITALGNAAVRDLDARLGDPGEPRLTRLTIPRILFQIGTEQALAVLLAHLDEPDETVRQKIFASASRLRLARSAPPVPLPEVRRRIDRELELHEALRSAYIEVRPAVRGPLLDELVISRLRKGLIRILRLCELAYPREVVASVRAHLFGTDAALRANALEVLESLLDLSLRERLVRLVDGFIAVRGGEFPPPATRTPAEVEASLLSWLRGQIGGTDSYAAALCLDAIARHGITSAGEIARAATEHGDPLVREAAAIAVAVTSPPAGAETLRRLGADPDAVVARYARYWAETGNTGMKAEDLMYTTIEKVLFLQRVSVFSRVAGDDLVPLARGADVMSLRRGEVIFRQGDPGGALYSVISGEVSLTVEGREVARLGESDVFGEMSIFDREPRAVTAVVAEEAELLRVSAEDFHDAVRETVEIAEAVIQVLNRRVRESDRRLAETRSRLSLLAPTPGPPGVAVLDDPEPSRDSDAPRAPVEEPELQ